MSQGKEREMVIKNVRKLLRLKKDSTPVQLTVLETQTKYLGEDIISEDDQRIPFMFFICSRASGGLSLLRKQC
jgi:hypothetical protein